MTFPSGPTRRDFLQTSASTALGLGLAGTLPLGNLWAKEAAAEAAAPESLVKTLYETLSPGQKEAICFDWDHKDEGRGLLRTRVSANWDITDKFVDSDFYKPEQREMIRKIFEGIIDPSWHERIDQQLDDDSGGFGTHNSIALFGEPGSEKFEFVLTGRHMTLRADGNTAEHVAFGGPIFYGHAADGFDETPEHVGNVFWPQAQMANKLYQMLDGEQQQVALVRKGMPRENRVGFRGEEGKFQGIAIRELASDQQEHMQKVLQKLVEPYRTADRDEVMQCLKAQGGLEACHLAYYAQDDLGGDGVWDNWRLEGPSFVWHYRGAPHVHVWVNVASDPGVKLNAG
jgi:hypothetical protein